MIVVGPGVALVASSCNCKVVGLTNTALAVTPWLMETLRRQAKPGPGSKNPEPLADVPVRTAVAEVPIVIDATLSEAGVAGGGACNFTIRTPQLFVASAISCAVHIV